MAAGSAYRTSRAGSGSEGSQQKGKIDRHSDLEQGKAASRRAGGEAQSVFFDMGVFNSPTALRELMDKAQEAQGKMN